MWTPRLLVLMCPVQRLRWSTAKTRDHPSCSFLRSGWDLAKNLFQVHGIASEGKTVVRRTLRRKEVLEFFAKREPCLVGIEACGTAHYWAREIERFGHEVRLMPPAYVKPYVKRNKNDAADAEAICEAVSRPTMRLCPSRQPNSNLS